MEYKFPCPIAKKCGACQLTNMTYKEQLSYKMATEIRLLGKFCRVAEIIPMNDPFHYRNKVQSAFGKTRSGQIISGVYQSGTHKIVKTDSCLLENETADRIICDIRKLIIKFGLSVFNENTQTGFLRHVLVKKAMGTGEVLVVLVTGNDYFKSKNDFCRELLKLHPEITSVVHNINSGFTSMILGSREQVLFGKGYITDELMGRKFNISSSSFYQINYEGTKILYSLAMEFAALNGTQTVIDAYAGVGTIGIIASGYAKDVISVELNPQAVKDARKNAALNGIKNIKFVCADATEFLLEAAENGEKADVVIMDPPRAGSTREFMQSVVKLAPSRVVYVSCNPETLARDLLYFVKHGYRAEKIQPVDMFPNTQHVETVVKLVRH